MFALKWKSHDLVVDQSTFVQVMAWYPQTLSHYLNHCWPRSIMLQLSAIITWSYIKIYCLHHCRNWGTISISDWTHKRHAIPHPNRVFYEYFWENWWRYNGTTLYYINGLQWVFSYYSFFLQFNIFMTHMSNYGNDRLALYLFESEVKFVQCWTNLQLKTAPPLEIARMYFEEFPDEEYPIWRVRVYF